ncbi:MAG TPA: non-canonical purine NTP pyrophosphatase [Candidatus Saccharimonadales bacterium]|nr:non-canonical purine NTP pyrophosphatase [Candidatus Saccharimonadales bacterium]
MRTITIATGNPGKVRELQALAEGQFDFTMSNIHLEEIQSLDLHEIVEDKVRRAFAIIKQPVIIEDVSAGLDHLNGLPGPFFKFFEKTLGKETFLKLSTVPNPTVTITCLAAYYDGSSMLFGEGKIHGSVVSPRGENGFGFDFTVVPDGQTRTMAEMSPAEKNAISHRGQAFRALLAEVNKL